MSFTYRLRFLLGLLRDLVMGLGTFQKCGLGWIVSVVKPGGAGTVFVVSLGKRSEEGETHSCWSGAAFKKKDKAS